MILERSKLPSSVTIVEVGPRDGLQNEAAIVPVEAKLAFIHALAGAGLPVVEATSFVSPKWVPQLADAENVLARLERRPGVRYPVLVPNEKGLERALAANVKEIAIFTAATDGFNKKNTNATVAESLERLAPVTARAKAAGLRVRGYVSTCFGCPYDGPVVPAAVARVAKDVLALGVDEISLGDTIGVATPGDVERVVGAVLEHVPLARIALHFHDTRGTALANVLAGLLLGVSIFDSSAGGLGGCPYAPGASGNLATEDLVYLCDGLGIATGVDVEKVRAASRALAAALGHALPGKYTQAGPVPWKKAP
jgi:isopropylmalate/homocitrate/citramalate synthase